MIKRFISEGIMGIPDMDIELGDEKIIVIKGPNGSGKTSLLRQITHPLSSHDRFNRLKEGYTDGHIIMYLIYNGVPYKIHHQYTLKSGKVKVLSYLFKKIDGEFTELTGNGLPSKFNDVVKYEFNYEKYLFDILNIGVSNKGIIDGTNIDRVEYLKKILRLNDLDNIKNNILDQIKEKNGSYKFIKSKLEEFLPIDTLKKKVIDIKNKSKEIDLNIKSREKELMDISSNTYDTEKMEEEVKRYNIQKRDLSNLYNILKDKDKNTTYNSLLEQLKLDKDLNNKDLAVYDSNIDRINSEIMNIKTVDNSKLNNEKKLLNDKINKFNEKYGNYKRYWRYSADELQSIKESINYSIDISSNFSYDILEKFKNNNRDDFDRVPDELKDKINIIEIELDDCNNKLEKINLSTNLINLKVPDDCGIPTCPLRLELKRQLDEFDVYNLLKDKKKSLEKELPTLNEEYEEAKDISNILKSIENKFNKFKFIYSFLSLEEDLNKVNDELFFLKFSEENKSNIKSLQKVEELLKISIDNGINKKKSLIEELQKYKSNRENILSSINKLDKKLNKYKLDLSDHNMAYMKLDEINEKINTVNIVLNNYTDKLREATNTEIIINNLNNEISDLRSKLQSLTDEYYKLKNQYEESKKYTNEFDKVSKDISDLNLIREVVNKKLPGKIIENYLNDVSNTVNNLLEDFLTIRFDTSDGIEIVINREGIERPSSALSQGERSILSMSLLLAFKKNIPWDIISFDELDATLDENNKSKFIYMLRDFSDLIPSIKQIFIVTHSEVSEDGMDTKIINLE